MKESTVLYYLWGNSISGTELNGSQEYTNEAHQYYELLI